MNHFKFPHRFRKSLDWLFEVEEGIENNPNNHWFIKTRKLLQNVKSLKRLLADYRGSLEIEKERNKVLNMFIEAKLKPPANITYICKHCTFRGKEYRDFCPGCSKDDSGKTPQDYEATSSTDTDSDK